MRIGIASLLLAAWASGCGGGSTSTSGSTAPSASTPPPKGLHGRVVGATEGWAHLIATDAAARSLPALAATVRDTVRIDAEGKFAFEGARGADRVLISAPGRALTWTPIGADMTRLAPAPEARVTCRVTDIEGTPQEDALALVVDADGRVLPLPPTELVADATGTLTATRLPAGRYELLVASGDDTRHAAAAVRVAAGDVVTVDVTVRADGALRDRYLRVVGAPWSPRTGAAEEAR